MLVIGTTAIVYPAAHYVTTARNKGARIAVVNMEAADEELGTAGNLGRRDFLFQGDAGRILPEILGGMIGEKTTGS
jgi:NAD-dependent SIR2 family protein deacetylase